MGISFLLNEKLVNTEMPAGMVLLDFIRYQQHLTGTKIGCREGDCGACTILCGEIKNNVLQYQALTSCLVPLGNVMGKHVVTIEGVNMKALNMVQQAIHDEAATQCGFCTPGIVMSLAGYCLQQPPQAKTDEGAAPGTTSAIAAVDGNICRCTGYKSIERAALKVAHSMRENRGGDPIKFLTSRSMMPLYFDGIQNKLKGLFPGSKKATIEIAKEPAQKIPLFLGGGTDLYVQQHQVMVHETAHFMSNTGIMKKIYTEGGNCVIGSAATVSDLLSSAIFLNLFPGLPAYFKMVSSTPIRNMATIAGNFVNASPIGDLTIFFMALDANIVLSNGRTTRELPLKQFFKAYKTLDKEPNEYIEKIWFKLPGKISCFHFEKVSKRTHLDIASVNTAIHLQIADQVITAASLTAGGVAPVPLFLSVTSAFLVGKYLTGGIFFEANERAQAEVSPISDARGTATYKRLLLKQLLKAHFLKFAPSRECEELLYL